jgi:Na+-transporting methylmalonyl-CoA/oxaloacetate decarboxylase gamma subunit
MTNWSFGFTMTLTGMGITLITLYLLTLLIRLLNKIFPHKIEEDEKSKPVTPKSS